MHARCGPTDTGLRFPGPQMERYNEVKRLLKTWETGFLKEKKRKPNKADVAESSEEMQNLYREFSVLKQERLSGPVAVTEETDSWGRHLNRTNVTPPMSAAERHSLTASVQYFGMKIKSNLGGALKDRPLSLKKSHLSRTPITVTREAAISSSPAGSPLDCSPGSMDDMANLALQTQPHKLQLTPSSQETPGRRLSHLQAKVGQRLTSLNPAWLERCERQLGGEKCLYIGSGERNGQKSEPPNRSTDQKPRRPVSPEQMASDQKTMADWQDTQTVQERGHKMEEPRPTDKPSRKSYIQNKRKSRPKPPSAGATHQGSTESSKAKDSCTSDTENSLKRPRDHHTDSESEEPKRHTKGSKRPSKKAKTRQKDPEEDPLMVTAQDTENLLGEVMDEVGTEHRVTGSTAKRISLGASRKRVGNYVRINLKKKSYVKGFALNGNRLRKQMWKQKWQKKGEQFGGGGRPYSCSEDNCFRCGQLGHWASQCPGRGVPLPRDSDAIPEEEEIVLPTLEEVARMTNTQLWPDPVSDLSIETPVPGPGPEMVLDIVNPVFVPSPPPPAMLPLYEPTVSGQVRETPSEVNSALRELGYETFRPGQEEAIMRILSGKMPFSLVILSTGMGKSLCYQLPAYMYAMRSPCITLVISPLVSLMDDQVSGLPSKLKAVCIHSNMTRTQREAAMEKVKTGKVHIVLLSPEALVGGGYSGSSCLPSAHQLPPVAFACIDEVHCVSEWSHNFRPCYLRLCKVLRERLGVRCILGLTATATLSTAQDVVRHLTVPDGGNLAMRLAAIPPNLHLSVSVDRDRDQALITLLKEKRFGSLESIIIYCTRREETQRLAAMLRTCLQGVTVTKTEDDRGDAILDRKKIEAKKKIRRPLKWMADTYHAGLSSAERRRVQNNFMSGQLRIVVATVAFGMGLDKSDVRGIIHYNMPKNFESYVQEIGRAGRDGRDAHCHLFLDTESQDLDELRRHVYSDSMDYYTVKKLVKKVFPTCRCRELQNQRVALNKGSEVDDSEMLELLEQCEGEDEKENAAPAGKERIERLCHGHERAIPIEETVQALDVREESIETLLCYLELHERCWLDLLHPTLSTCRVTCYSGPQQLRSLARSCPPVAVALARERLSGVDLTHVSSVEFNVVDLADSMGWEIIPVKRALRDLQWKSSSTAAGSCGTGRSGVLVEFSKLSFHFRSYGDLTSEELEEVCDFLHQKVTSREATALRQLKSCYRVFHSVAYRSSGACAEKVNPERSAQLKTLILHYFEGKEPLNDPEEADLADGQVKAEDWKAQVYSDVRLFLSIHQDECFSGRSVARVFHGISSPCYPAQIYGRDRRFWRKYLHLDFNNVMQLCKEEILRLK
ncbi:LOW QUALITY PROTEIN: ATP-dependent DNA helicase Q4 [Anomaloglossus baeobatrachus]|uniref:LOW QUALITY PROTEIN: ATP-dependent DNA helicase Q4 n=1 Tax=Anomaloglossus baeobatrachus TaxID=238106 RepID=UPI003F501158